MCEELIRAKRCDIRWIINHLNEIIEYMENSQYFQETDIDFPAMSLAYHTIFEVRDAMEKQHNNYSKLT